MNHDKKDTEQKNKLRQSDVFADDINRTYNTPKLIRYGGIAEIVQRRSGRAMDGEVAFPDCTLT